MIFKIHPNSIDQILATIEQLGPCYFHGDGNIYLADKENEVHSTFRKKFSNPNNEGAGYRVKFSTVEQVPKTVEALERALFEARNSEVAAANLGKEVAGSKIVTVRKSGDEGSKLQVRDGEGSGAGDGLVVKPLDKMNKVELQAEMTKRELPFVEEDTKAVLIAAIQAKDQA